MKSKIILGLVLIFFVANISAICEDGQIDINSASIEKLKLLKGIADVKAQAIIDGRPFDNLDDLFKVKGIKNATLNWIKNQSLACVSFEETEIESNPENEIVEKTDNEEEEEEIDNDEEKDIENEKIHEKTNERFEELIFKAKAENVERELINLNPKDIKMDKDKEKLDKSNYAIYGFVTFCVLLLFLFIVKNKNQFNKNEFR